MSSLEADVQLQGLLEKPWSVTRSRQLFMDARRPMWKNARAVSFEIEVAAAAARRWLPPTLKPVRPAKATIFVADYPDVGFGIPYRECGVLLHALWRGERVLHCAWMVVDDDTAMILGRELLGFPKKLARIDFHLDESGGCNAAVTRRDTVLIHIEASRPVRSPGSAMLPYAIVNAKGTASLVPGSLWRMEVPQEIQKAWSVRADVRIGGSPFDPLQELGVGERQLRAQTLITDLAVPSRATPSRWGQLRRLLANVRPVGLVPYKWMIERIPFRSM